MVLVGLQVAVLLLSLISGSMGLLNRRIVRGVLMWGQDKHWISGAGRFPTIGFPGGGNAYLSGGL
ncbi:hypothetical protein CL673_01270 [Candidatus Bathyarchaeota archaeon]|nr:hypothetical protein [Candidatus Bathyarchaeota archaeon]